MRHQLLIAVAPAGETHRKLLTAFKKQHGIVTQRCPGMQRKEHPWVACLINQARRLGYGTTADSTLFDCIAHVGRLMDESGILVTGEGELSAVRLLCKRNGIHCPL